MPPPPPATKTAVPSFEMRISLRGGVDVVLSWHMDIRISNHNNFPVKMYAV